MALATNSAAAAGGAASQPSTPPTRSCASAFRASRAARPRSSIPSRAFAFLPMKRRTISAIHAADPLKNNGPAFPAAAVAKSSASVVAMPEKKPAALGKWAVDSWKSKKALQLPEYPNQEELDIVQEFEAKTDEHGDQGRIFFKCSARNWDCSACKFW